jgi:hypothetical protein
MGRGLRSFSQNTIRHRKLSYGERHRAEELRGISGARRVVVTVRTKARARCHRTRGAVKGRNLPRRRRQALCPIRGLHASGLPSALEFLRNLLGLSLPWVSIRIRRDAAQRPSDKTAGRGRDKRLILLEIDALRRAPPCLRTDRRRVSEVRTPPQVTIHGRLAK